MHEERTSQIDIVSSGRRGYKRILTSLSFAKVSGWLKALARRLAAAVYGACGRMRRMNWVVALSVIGSIASIYGLTPVVHDQLAAWDSTNYEKLSEKLYSEFYGGDVDIAAIKATVGKIRSIKSSLEAELIEISALVSVKKKDEASKALAQVDFSQHEVDRNALMHLYGIFIDTYDYDRGCTPISVLAFGRDEKSVFFGPNLTKQRLFEWIKTFQDPWLVMPVFRYSCMADSDYDFQMFDYMIQRYPRSAWLYTMRGRSLFGGKYYKRSIDDFTIALTIDDGLPETWLGRARAYEEEGKYDAALSDYNKAISLNDGRCISYLDRAVLKGKLQDYEGAIADNTRSLTLCPKLYQAYQNRATDLRKVGRVEEAVRDYTFVIENADVSDTKLSALNDKIGMFLINKQNSIACNNEDISLLRGLIQKSYGNKISHNILAICEEWNGNFQNAVRDNLEAWESLQHQSAAMSDTEKVIAQNILSSLYHFYPDDLSELEQFRVPLSDVVARMLGQSDQTLRGILLAGLAGDRAHLLKAIDFPLTMDKFNRMSSEDRSKAILVGFAVLLTEKARPSTNQSVPKAWLNFVAFSRTIARQASVAAQFAGLDKMMKASAAESTSRSTPRRNE